MLTLLLLIENSNQPTTISVEQRDGDEENSRMMPFSKHVHCTDVVIFIHDNKYIPPQRLVTNRLHIIINLTKKSSGE